MKQLTSRQILDAVDDALEAVSKRFAKEKQAQSGRRSSSLAPRKVAASATLKHKPARAAS